MTSPAFQATRATTPDVFRRVSTSVDLTINQRVFLEVFAIENNQSMVFIMHTIVDILQARRDIAQFVIDIIFQDNCPDEIVLKTGEHKRLPINFRGSHHSFLRLFAAHNGTKIASILRALLYLLSHNESFRELVIENLVSYTVEDNVDSDPLLT